MFWLPGSGDTPKNFQGLKADEWIYETLLICREGGIPLVMVAVDGLTHWQNSQYIDSPATGLYQQYIADELVPFIEKKYNIGGSIHNRIIGGHSSGGFGALRMGASRPDVFNQVIALSPDSDFNISHLPVSDSVDQISFYFCYFF
jgi:enterochelin esterase-like enzyme